MWSVDNEDLAKAEHVLMITIKMSHHCNEMTSCWPQSTHILTKASPHQSLLRCLVHQRHQSGWTAGHQVKVTVNVLLHMQCSASKHTCWLTVHNYADLRVLINCTHLCRPQREFSKSYCIWLETVSVLWQWSVWEIWLKWRAVEIKAASTSEQPCCQNLCPKFCPDIIIMVDWVLIYFLSQR